MILWILQWVFISALLISLIHYLYSFFENILSVPKMKDLINPKPPIANTENKMENKINTNNEEMNMEVELEQYLQDITKPKTI